MRKRYNTLKRDQIVKVRLTKKEALRLLKPSKHKAFRKGDSRI